MWLVVTQDGVNCNTGWCCLSHRIGLIFTQDGVDLHILGLIVTQFGVNLNNMVLIVTHGWG
jgi:hypothetical protein